MSVRHVTRWISFGKPRNASMLRIGRFVLWFWCGRFTPAGFMGSQTVPCMGVASAVPWGWRWLRLSFECHALADDGAVRLAVTWVGWLAHSQQGKYALNSKRMLRFVVRARYRGRRNLGGVRPAPLRRARRPLEHEAWNVQNVQIVRKVQGVQR